MVLAHRQIGTEYRSIQHRVPIYGICRQKYPSLQTQSTQSTSIQARNTAQILPLLLLLLLRSYVDNSGCAKLIIRSDQDSLARLEVQSGGSRHPALELDPGQAEDRVLVRGTCTSNNRIPLHAQTWMYSAVLCRALQCSVVGNVLGDTSTEIPAISL